MFERREKPWGYEEIWAKTDKYVAKKIHINKGHRLSLQYHNKKEETIYVQDGTLLVVGEDGIYSFLSQGESLHIKPKVIHRFCATNQDVTIFEVSTTELDDVVRLEDDYGRSE